MRSITITCLSIIMSCCAWAQDAVPEPGQANRYDENGKKNGVWWQSFTSNDGEHGCHEWGYYIHGRKTGAWYKINGEGELLAEENYRNDALDGEVKYYYEGHLTSVGHYRGLNPDNLYDTIVVVDPVTGAESLRPVLNDKGSLKHGNWKFYDEETGRLIREEEYQVDELVLRKDYPMSKADSIFYARRDANLPHNKKVNYTAPPAKIFSYINYK